MYLTLKNEKVNYYLTPGKYKQMLSFMRPSFHNLITYMTLLVLNRKIWSNMLNHLCETCVYKYKMIINYVHAWPLEHFWILCGEFIPIFFKISVFIQKHVFFKMHWNSFICLQCWHIFRLTRRSHNISSEDVKSHFPPNQTFKISF